MYGLKAETDISFLKGRELIQVAIGRYQVIFALDEGVTISVEGRFEIHIGESSMYGLLQQIKRLRLP